MYPLAATHVFTFYQIINTFTVLQRVHANDNSGVEERTIDNRRTLTRVTLATLHAPT
jgi:hypothetical protein